MTNDCPLISVIVPVYKVEQYLHRCVDSILNQTYTNLEVVLVDDGSPDRCGEICDEYAKKDSRIVVIHQENCGLSAARNAGLDICTGAYIAFVDSDDYIAQNMYEKMLETIVQTGSDICVCQWQYERADGCQVIDPGKIDSSIYGKKSSVQFAEYFYRGQYESGVVCAAWNKLYKRAVFSTVRFFGQYVEDERIHNHILSNAYTISVITDLLYVYCQNMDSLTNKPFRNETLLCLDVLSERAEIFEKHRFIGTNTWERYCEMYVEYYYKAQSANIKMPNTKEFDRMFIKLLRVGKCNVKFYVRMCLFRMSPKLYAYFLGRKYEN